MKRWGFQNRSHFIPIWTIAAAKVRIVLRRLIQLRWQAEAGLLGLSRRLVVPDSLPTKSSRWAEKQNSPAGGNYQKVSWRSRRTIRLSASRGVFSSGTWPPGAAPAFYSAWCRGKRLFSPQGTDTGEERKKNSHFIHEMFYLMIFVTLCDVADYCSGAWLSPSVLLLQPSQWWNVLRLCWVHRSAQHICHSCQLGGGKKKRTRRLLRRSDASRLKTIEEALAGGGKKKPLTHASDLLVPREVWKIWSETLQESSRDIESFFYCIN